jgi:hypothetical protein
MCYADGAEGAAGMLERCAVERFDCGFDDYFNASAAPDAYLATHWNLGSTLNRFLEFTDVLPGEDLTVQEPCCTDDGPGVTDDAVAIEPAVRILGRPARVRNGRVRVTLACPAERTVDCRGWLDLRRGRRPGAVGRSFSISTGRHGVVRLRLRPDAWRAWSAGRLRRVRIVADEIEADAPVARTVAVARPPAAPAAAR